LANASGAAGALAPLQSTGGGAGLPSGWGCAGPAGRWTWGQRRKAAAAASRSSAHRGPGAMRLRPAVVRVANRGWTSRDRRRGHARQCCGAGCCRGILAGWTRCGSRCFPWCRIAGWPWSAARAGSSPPPAPRLSRCRL